MLRLLFIGDVIGKPGRVFLERNLARIIKEHRINLVIANGENSAGGLGTTKKAVRDLFSAGVDVVTGGNHIWDNKDIFNFIDKETRLLRPLNLSPHSPGRGMGIFHAGNLKVGIINLVGRVFMPPADCPFTAVYKAIGELKKQASVILVDFHAEATSEKMALGWHLDGMVSGLIGTHTHVQTADERILPHSTAYITDVGMTGPYHSVIGVDKDKAVYKFLTGMPVSLKVNNNPPVQFNAVLLEIDAPTGKCVNIKRLHILCHNI